MVHQRIALATAEFLDSPWARSISGVPRESVRFIAEAFLESCYDGLGLEPRLLDAEHLRELVAQRLPGRFARKDERVAHVPAVIEALVEHLASTTVMSQAFEVRRALDAASAECVESVRAGRNLPEAPAKVDPYVHGADKLGRNDPCSCGSGKKFKKCHGKDS